MPLTEQHTQENLSKAYVAAVAGKAGMILLAFDNDYGVDGAYRPVARDGTRSRVTPYTVDYQLKASTDWTHDTKTGEIVYDLKVKNYNDMVARDEDDPGLYLFLLCLPQDRDDWLSVSEDQLVLRNCCYWYRVTGERSKNAETVRLRIPSANILDPDAMTKLIEAEESRLAGMFK